MGNGAGSWYCRTYMEVSINGVPKNGWFLLGKIPNLKWMTGGTPMTKRKLPYVVILVPELGILIEQALMLESCPLWKVSRQSRQRFWWKEHMTSSLQHQQTYQLIQSLQSPTPLLWSQMCINLYQSVGSVAFERLCNIKICGLHPLHAKLVPKHLDDQKPKNPCFSPRYTKGVP